ncbi:hypothetical protein DMA11_15280 [Marinilabiliaceae bacterium JC017]|nr:hypothetical protein DMA11_15280 [Marinilabiliaceae bacterium JC017]
MILDMVSGGGRYRCFRVVEYEVKGERCEIILYLLIKIGCWNKCLFSNVCVFLARYCNPGYVKTLLFDAYICVLFWLVRIRYLAIMRVKVINHESEGNQS